MERNNITVSTLYKNKINPKMSSMGCNLNIFDLLEYIKNFNTSLVNLEGKYIGINDARMDTLIKQSSECIIKK